MNTMTNQTITEYVADKGITAEVVRDRGAQVQEGWEHHAYELRLHNPATGESLDTDWRQGYGIEESPIDRPDSVLDALVSDAAGYLNARDWDDYADEFGLDHDSLKGYRTYEAVRELAPRVVAFLGGQEEFEHVAYEVERL